ncbi:F-box protein At3g07870-like [Magnolia sinica]|uniref:F-box protein At3g07870-like n=1 Tax=Magnolia sinica TaxID=86752 RepID=UPI00265AA331|nr:F-box protein At3g07870-like [Magnolia sinica]
MAEKASFLSDRNDENGNKEEKLERAPALSDDVIFNILLRLPPESLPNLRLVCKNWYNVISDPLFIEAHLHRSEPGFIFQKRISRSKCKTHFMEIKEGDIKVHDLDLHCPGRICASCNGLILLESMLSLYVINPISKQRIILPPSDLSFKYPLSYEIYGFGFNSITKEYKVVHVCEYKKRKTPIPLGCEITTVGSDSWREIDGPFFGLTELRIPISASGILHWAIGMDYIVSMDVGNEKFHKTPFPNCSRRSYHFLELGEFLSFANRESPVQIDVWILKDLDGGEWIKQLSIGVDCLGSLLSQDLRWGGSLDPVLLLASFRNGEVIIFECFAIDIGGFYLYDFKLERIIKFDGSCGIQLIAMDTLSSPIHVNSLVSCEPRNNRRYLSN